MGMQQEILKNTASKIEWKASIINWESFNTLSRMQKLILGNAAAN